MKKTYQNPTTKIFKIETGHIMQATSTIAVGSAYEENGTVLSRDGDFWDDEE